MSLAFIPSLRLQLVHLSAGTFLLEHCSSFGHMFFPVQPANHKSQQVFRLSYVAEISLPYHCTLNTLMNCDAEHHLKA